MSPRIGRYQILGEIARGGMGVVYRAHDPQTGRDVALKLLGVDAAPSQKQLDRFRREYEALARLRHPGVVPIHDTDAHDGRPYFVQALVEGPSLRDRLDAEGPLPQREVAQIAHSLANSLAYLHEQGVCHRDLKPANILLAPHGPVLIDFGLVKDLSLLLSKPSLTKTGLGFGTPGFWSPEQALGEKRDASGAPVGPASDLFSLGATLYALLTGRPPFPTATAIGNVIATTTQDPEPPSSLRRDLDPDLEAIVLKCLEKDAENRFSAAELSDDLARYLAGEAVTASPTSRGKRWPWWIAAAVFITLGSGMASLASRDLREEADTSATLFDDVAPLLSLAHPVDWQVISADQVTLRGAVLDLSRVRVSVGEGPSAHVDPQNKTFELTARLRHGINRLQVDYTDAAGNRGPPLILRVLRPPPGDELLRDLRRSGGALLVTEPLRVEPGKTLVLGPGTRLTFQGGGRIECRGQLWCLGTSDSPVILSGLPNSSWAGLELDGASALGVLSGTQIRDVSSDATRLLLDPSEEGLGGAIRIRSGARLIMTDSEILGCNGAADGGGLHVSSSSSDPSRALCLRSRISDCTARRGAGLYCGPGGSIDLESCVLSSNVSTDQGGGVFAATGSSISLTRTRLERNEAEGSGGGASIEGDAEIEGTTFLSNRAGDRGGGLEIIGADERPIVITETRFEQNRGGIGGGASLGRSTRLTNCHFLENQATHGGGGANLWRGGKHELDTVIFARNTAPAGAGANLFGVELVLQNSEFDSNRATGKGGGLLSENSALECIGVTFKSNEASEGGGLWLKGKAILRECAFESNVARRHPDKCLRLAPLPDH